jgi:hypothetical protein
MSESGFTGLKDLQDYLIRNPVNPKILKIKILTIFTGLLVRNPKILNVRIRIYWIKGFTGLFD